MFGIPWSTGEQLRKHLGSGSHDWSCTCIEFQSLVCIGTVFLYLRLSNEETRDRKSVV